MQNTAKPLREAQTPPVLTGDPLLCEAVCKDRHLWVRADNRSLAHGSLHICIRHYQWRILLHPHLSIFLLLVEAYAVNPQ